MNKKQNFWGQDFSMERLANLWIFYRGKGYYVATYMVK